VKNSINKNFDFWILVGTSIEYHAPRITWGVRCI